MGKHLLNRVDAVVQESLEGLCIATPHLQLLDGFPDVKVLFDSTAVPSRVAVISGGGSGHEPAHCGYVGKGMLTAAVCGDIFASPPTEAVLAAIQTVSGDAGCLLIVKNYTGDRLNFGLAAEQAQGLGIKVETIIVGDDCALPGTGIAGRRGIAGTVFVHKIAGAASAAGLPLEKVKTEAEAAANAVGSMGMATSICNLPGSQPSTRLGDGEMEMGLGIHGEPGASRGPIQPVDTIVAQLLTRILDSTKLAAATADVALLVNNLGATPSLELYVAARAAAKFLADHTRLRVVRMYVGAFMTALDMAGFSLSLLQLSPRHLELLDAATQAPAWPTDSSPAEFKKPKSVPKSVGELRTIQRAATLSASEQTVESCIARAADALCAAAPQLDEWDQRVGDGDCGSTVKRGAEAIKAALSGMPVGNAAATAASLAHAAKSMGGSSGALYSILFSSVSASLSKVQQIDGRALAAAFSSGVAAISHYGGAQRGDRTMLDALLPASEAYTAAIEAGQSLAEAAGAAAAASREGVEATKRMSASAGRSSYIQEDQLAGIPDPGAAAVAIWLDAVAAELSR